jgi:hypothetical protein
MEVIMNTVPMWDVKPLIVIEAGENGEVVQVNAPWVAEWHDPTVIIADPNTGEQVVVICARLEPGEPVMVVFVSPPGFYKMVEGPLEVDGLDNQEHEMDVYLMQTINRLVKKLFVEIQYSAEAA